MKLVATAAAIERAEAATRIARHRHAAPYAALVLRGRYVESGDRGRFRVAAGEVLFHMGFEAHQDRFEQGPVEILNLPLARRLPIAAARVVDPDAIVRASETDRAAAAELLLQNLVAGPVALDDWPDRLAAALVADEVERIDEWAAAHRLAPETVSRGFRAAYGVPPRVFRLEQRARRAATALSATRERCADIAANCGFADQAHMSRTIRSLYDMTPAKLRAA